jgi:sRNA-binding carbon storage regulator CsrA
VLEVLGNRVRIGIRAPGALPIVRRELLLRDARSTPPEEQAPVEG